MPARLWRGVFILILSNCKQFAIKKQVCYACVTMNKRKLQQAGHKLTQPRSAVLKALERTKRPLSAKEIHGKAPGVDLASIYRTLKLLSELGIAFEETVENESRYYLGESQHHHITCQGCGKTECVPCNHKLPAIKQFTNITHQLALSGTCRRCAQ